jgi:hypothetical protein
MNGMKDDWVWHEILPFRNDAGELLQHILLRTSPMRKLPKTEARRAPKAPA